MIAAKHLDIVMGVDIHMILVPTPAGPVPTPIPHPFVGMLFDPDDYDPMAMAMAELNARGIDLTPALDIMNTVSAIKGTIAGGIAGQVENMIEGARDAIKNALNISPTSSDAATIFVNGLPRAHAGSKGPAMPPHIPIGGMWQPPPPKNKCEAFMGSALVLAQGRPMTFSGCMALSCASFGMPSMHNMDGTLFMPTSSIIAVPKGRIVMVGGPPVPDMMALANQIVDKMFDSAVSKLKNSKMMKGISKAIHNTAGKLMDKIGVPADMRKAVHDDICEATGHPVTIATGKVYTSKTDFRIPGPIPIVWSRKWDSVSVFQGHLGNGWHSTFDIALAVNRVENVAVARMKDGRPVIFPPIKIGEKFTNPFENLTLIREANHYILKEGNLHFRFDMPSSTIRMVEEVYPLSAIEDGLGHRIQFKYDKDKHLKEITDSAGRILKVQCNRMGCIEQIEAPHPSKKGEKFIIVSYKYDERGNMLEQNDPLGKSFKYRYKDDLLVKETNRNGLSFFFEYNKNERCIHTWGDGGIYDHKLEYNLEERWTKVTDSLGNTTQYFWTEKGVNWKIVDPYGKERFKRYTRTNKIQTIINEVGDVTSYDYDSNGNKTAIKYPDNTSIVLNYNEDNQLIGATDQIGGSWAWEYNENGRLVRRTDSTGRITEYTYEDGRVAGIIDPAGGKTTIAYDEMKNFSSLTSPDGATSLWKYDGLGRPVESIDPKGNTQKRKYNYLGRVLKVWERDGNIRELKYDAEGNITHVKDKHHEVKFEYAQMNRLKARTEAKTRVEFKYDTEGNLLGIINEHGYAYRFELDKKFRVITESGFDGLTRKFTRDELGRVKEVQRASGIKTKYEHDAMGRILEVIHSNGEFEKYAYRLDGELIEATNNNIKVQFERDPLGRILKEIQGGFEVESQYDILGLRTEVNSSLGAHIEFKRNIMGDVESVNADSNGSNWEAEFKRDIFGLEMHRKLPGGVESEWKRDQLGRPVEHKTSTGGNTDRTKKYTWDVNSRLKQIEDSKHGITQFEHDVFGNLSAAHYGDGTSEYRMPDEVGNLFRRPDRSDRKYGPAGQLIEAEGTKYEYDAEGNLICKLQKDGSLWKYSWNAAGMLQKVKRPDGDEVVFAYDALGRRISKRYRDKTTRWVWDGNVMLHEWIEETKYTPPKKKETATVEPTPGAIKIKKRKIKIASEPTNAPPTKAKIRIKKSGSELRVASATSASESSDLIPETKKEAATPTTLTSQPSEAYQPVTHNPNPADLTTWIFEPGRFAPIAKIKDNQQFSILTDHLGTPVSMYNEKGKQTWGLDLSIYGETRSLEGWKGTCPFRYPGQYEDEETGLYYNRFRYYDAEGGFYISQDPIRLVGGKKLYSYVHDPSRWIDPYGLEGCEADIEDIEVTILNDKGKEVTAFRKRNGDPDKVAVIGRNMGDRVVPFAKEIGAETWEGWDENKSNAENLAANKEWADKLVEENYTVYDVGLDPKYSSKGNTDKGDYYGMETEVIFGDTD